MESLRSRQTISVLQAWEPLQVLGKERRDYLGGLESPLRLQPGAQIAGESQEAGSPGRRLLQLSRQEGLGLEQGQ